MRILLTGGAGFIGSHVVEAYLRLGHEVVVVDDLSSGSMTQVDPKATFVRADVGSSQMKALIRDFRPDVINHHAAQKSIPRSVAEPVADLQANVVALVGMLHAAVQVGVPRFLFASSGGALAGRQLPSIETASPDLASPYALNKLTCELYLALFARTHGLQYVAMRYGNAYGPRQRRDGECGVIPTYMEQIENGLPCRLHRFADMPDGATRDYVYVSDLVRANVAALDRATNCVVNLGCGVEVSTRRIYETVVKHAPGPVSGGVELLAKRPGDLKRSALDSGLAHEKLGWVAEVSLEEGIERTWRWWSQRGPKNAPAPGSAQRPL